MGADIPPGRQLPEISGPARRAGGKSKGKGTRRGGQGIALALGALLVSVIVLAVVMTTRGTADQTPTTFPNAVLEVTFTNLSSEGQGFISSSPPSFALVSRYWSFDHLVWTGWGSPRAVAKGVVSNGATADPTLVTEPTTVILSDLQMCDGLPHYLAVRYYMNRGWRTGSHQGCSLLADRNGGI